MKTHKKLVSLAAAAAMCASVMSPLAASANLMVSSIDLIDDDTAVVSAASEGIAIIASYDGGRLASVKTTPVEAGSKTNFSVKTGDKVMLWSDLKGEDNGEPLTDAVTVEAAAATPTPTAEAKPTPIILPTQNPGTEPTPTAAADATPKPTAEAIQSWKFDFGTAENTAEGYTAVAADSVYSSNTALSPQHGFLGTDGHGDDYDTYIDGVETKEGQNVTLKAGAKETVATAADDYLGVDTEAEYKIKGDYPIRFGMKAENNHYYRVKATVTTFDQSKDAVVSVFSERRHPMLLEETLTAGETRVVEFVATPQNVRIKDRAAGQEITYADNMLNVVVVGDNAALASIEVDEINHVPTIWMYDDSTGCDYPMLQPYFPLQNYGGTGAFITKYLRKDYAISNQGDGGINAADGTHWAAARDNISAGDYVYVQYGHNHKDDGAVGYLQAIPKYYEKANSVGAYTLYVGPIDRHNSSQYNASTNTWSSTLNGFSKAAKYYTEILITGGKAKADEFVAKAKSESENGTSVANSTYEWADQVIAAGITADGAKDVAFVDLNQPTLDWLAKVCEDVKTARGAENYESNASDYYFRAVNGSSVDGTHANDAGADNTASFFFSEAKKTVAKTDEISKVEAAILEPLVTDMRTEETNAYKVSDEIVKLGKAPNSAWPLVYVASNLPKLPVVIKDIQFNEDGTAKNVTIYKQEAEKDMGAYGIIDITVYNSDKTEKGHIYSATQVDNTWNNGITMTLDSFRYDPADLVLNTEAGETYDAIVRKAIDADADNPLRVNTEDPDNYSAVYEPTDIDQLLMTNQDGDGIEKFIYRGAEDGTDVSTLGWTFIGSAGHTTALGTKSADEGYLEIMSNGGGSFYLWKGFDSTAPEVTNTGIYMFDADIQYISGGGVDVMFTRNPSNNTRTGSENIVLFTINSNGEIDVAGTPANDMLSQGDWINVRYILDMDLGTATVSVGGGDPVVVKLANYDTADTTVTPSQLNALEFSKNNVAYNVKIANMTVAKLKRTDALPKYTLTTAVNSDSTDMGTTAIVSPEPVEGSVTAEINTVVNVKATPADGNVFINWLDADGKAVSTDADYTFRLRGNTELKAVFMRASGIDGITDYGIAADKSLVKAGAEATVSLSLDNVVDKNKNTVEVTNADAEWSVPADSGVTVNAGVVTVPADFEIGANTTKDVTVTAKLNDIEKKYTFKVYSYAFYENIQNGMVSSAWDGFISTVANEYGLRFGKESGNDTDTRILGIAEPVALGDSTKISFRASSAKTCGQPRSIEFYDSKGNKVFDTLFISWGDVYLGGSYKKIDGTNQMTEYIGKFSGVVAANKWSSDVTVTLNKTAGTATVNFGTAEAISTTINSASEDIASIKLNVVSGGADVLDRLYAVTDITIQN